MISIEPGKGSGTFIDSLFSTGVNLLQSTVVRVAVMIENNQHPERRPPPSQDLQRQLRELGLIPERFWWGPMTLHTEMCQFIIAEIESRPPKRLLEVGSGTSTAIFAVLAEKYDFSVLSLENHRKSIQYVQSILEGLPCSRRVTIQKCNFVREIYPSGKKYRCYDADLERAEGQFDFVFIDGPMESLVGRNGVLPLIIPYLSEDHRIYFDDVKRTERLCLEEWKRHFPNLIFERCSAWGLGQIKVRHP
jgi:16S rRNA G966 N2-methylase RsmD